MDVATSSFWTSGSAGTRCSTPATLQRFIWWWRPNKRLHRRAQAIRKPAYSKPSKNTSSASASNGTGARTAVSPAVTWMLATVLRQSQYEALCRCLGAPELVGDPRYADFDTRAEHKDTLIAAIQAAFLKDTTANWVDRLRAADVLCSPVNSSL